jgi:hypothetical protein
MKDELDIMQSSAKIKKKVNAGHGQESKWEIPIKTLSLKKMKIFEGLLPVGPYM